MRRDGSYWAFIAPATRETDFAGPSHLWWWPKGAMAPTKSLSPYRGVDSISVDPASERILISYALKAGRASGIDLIDLRTGSSRQVVSERVAEATFSPDGRRIVTWPETSISYSLQTFKAIQHRSTLWDRGGRSRHPNDIGCLHVIGDLAYGRVAVAVLCATQMSAASMVEPRLTSG